MQVRATAKQVRISPRKMGMVAALVRRRSVSDALVILEHTPRRAAKVLREVLKSAAANAENNHRAEVKSLAIESVLVSNARIIKRIQAVSRGRAHPYRHRLSNVTVVVEDAGSTKEKEA